MLTAEANHRIANSLGMLGAFIQLKVKTASGLAPPAADILADVLARIEIISELHRLLAATKTDRICCRAYLLKVCDCMRLAFSDGESLAVAAEGPSVDAPADRVQQIGMVIAELISNSVKYAHPAGLPVRARLSWRIDRNRLAVSYADDGVGFPEDFDPMRDGGVGLQQIHALCASLSAEFAWRSGGLGAGFWMAAPLEEAAPLRFGAVSA